MLSIEGMSARSAADEIVRLVKKFAEREEGLKEARDELRRGLADLRARDAPSSLLLALKRNGNDALNPRSKRRLHAMEAVIWAVFEWKRETGEQ